MIRAWFRVQVIVAGRKLPTIFGKWYNLIAIPRVGDEVVFDDSNDDCNCAVVKSVTHWMPHKSKSGREDLEEQIVVIDLVSEMKEKYLPHHGDEDINETLEYEMEVLIETGFVESDWLWGAENAQ